MTARASVHRLRGGGFGPPRALPLLLLAACGAPTIELSSNDVPACKPAELSEWTRVRRESLGVRGHDPVGHAIDYFPAEKFGFANVDNWHPLSGYKETLCGMLHRFDVYDGFGSEMDWNHFIIPAPGFEFILTDALPYKGGSGAWCLDDEWHDCVGSDDCVEGELTPHESFYANPWFPKSGGPSDLEGEKICVYGPWIRECVHGHRPEIHTAELTWWKECLVGAERHWLMLHQDDSDRFDEADEFDTDGEPPAGWRPWAAAPLAARFQLAFEVDPAGPALQLEIGEAFARNVVTSSHAELGGDASEGVEHVVAYDGEVVLRAREAQAADEHVGVTFAELCRRPDGALQGYLGLATSVGVSNDGKEGLHVLSVTAGEAQPPAPPAGVSEPRETVVVVARGAPSSLRSATVEGRPQLFGDVRFEVRGGRSAAPDDLRVASVELASAHFRGEVGFEPGPKENEGLLRDVPLIDRAELVFGMRSGATAKLGWPGLGVGAPVGETTTASSAAAPSAWPAVLAAAEGAFTEPLRSLSVKQAEEVRLRVVPRYALLKNERASLEEGSPFVERLNEVLEDKDDAAMKALFGRDPPFRIAWSVEAVDLAKQTRVPVAGGAVSAQTVTTEFSDDTLVLTLDPPPDSVIEVRATVKVLDVFGSTTTTERRVWSHFLGDVARAAVERALLPAVAEAARVPADDLLAPLRLGTLSPDDPRLRDPRIRRAQVVRTYALQAADDAAIDVGELASMIRGAKRLRSE
jgi:hypothetical protein